MDTGTNHIDLLKLSTQGSEGKILLKMLENDIFPTVICVQWDGVLQGIETAEFVERMYMQPLISAGYELIYDNGRLKHTFLKIN